MIIACGSNTQSSEPQQEPETLDKVTSLSIYPLADGGAYAFSGKTIWYLKGAEAVRVKEVESLSAKPMALNTTQRERFFFSMWQDAETKRQALQLEQYQADEPDPEPYDPY
jgi:hypothetical protein